MMFRKRSRVGRNIDCYRVLVGELKDIFDNPLVYEAYLTSRGRACAYVKQEPEK